MVKLIGSIFSPYLSYSFVDKENQLSVEIVECPGLWMPEERLKKLVTDLKEIVKKSIPGESLHYGAISGSKEALDKSIITIIYDLKDATPLAFNALAVMPCKLRGKPIDVIHLGLVVVAPGRREGGFSWILYGLTTILIFLRSRLRPLWVSNVTQVPAILGKVTESFSQVYPSPKSNTRRSFNHLVLARYIMKKHRHVFGVGPDADFDEQKFIISNAYTGGSEHLKKTFAQAQKHRNTIYNEFCEKNLDYQRGDDYLQLGKLDLSATLLYLQNSVPKNMLFQVWFSFILLALQGLFLPVLHWFQENEYQGDLRPWKG